MLPMVTAPYHRGVYTRLHIAGPADRRARYFRQAVGLVGKAYRRINIAGFTSSIHWGIWLCSGQCPFADTVFPACEGVKRDASRFPPARAGDTPSKVVLRASIASLSGFAALAASPITLDFAACRPTVLCIHGMPGRISAGRYAAVAF